MITTNAAHHTNPIPIRRLPIQLKSDDRRVIARPLILGSHRVRTLFDRVSQLDELTVESLLAEITRRYGARHDDLLAIFEEHYHAGARLAGASIPAWTHTRRLLAGAYLSMEYSIDSAALFNPSIVPDPDQTNLPPGSLRFIMSLRATGEGHVSSLVFRRGIISANGNVQVDPPPARFYAARISANRVYAKKAFAQKLTEMGVNPAILHSTLSRLPDRFTLPKLAEILSQLSAPHGSDEASALRLIQWVAQSNYHVDLDPGADLSEMVIFPLSAEESHGIEDVRLTRFVDDNEQVTYYGTYTAYNGARTLPMLISTTDFRRFEFQSLNGACAANKGMALFPRKIGGQYVMCTRIDGENLYISTSHSVHFWDSAERIMVPRFPWELMQIGNCGSPLETEAGWLLLTHGVGPMRSYAIGAMLLDRDDPMKVIGHLRQPLIVPLDDERDGYVPNVVYTCGALIHRHWLIVPYAQADKSTSIAIIDLNTLLEHLVTTPPT